jgi:hypothetical protein
MNSNNFTEIVAEELVNVDGGGVYYCAGMGALTFLGLASGSYGIAALAMASAYTNNCFDF